MDLPSILHQIDTEITKLHQIRAIVQELAGSRRESKFRKPRRPKPATAVPLPSTSAPELVIVLAKQKREYSPRLKPTATMSRALGPAPSDKPVFVPRASVAFQAEQNHRLAEVPSLEAVVRQNLLGGAA
jgi:hypothetical protein